jgi:CheY-like chemotaxis protein
LSRAIVNSHGADVPVTPKPRDSTLLLNSPTITSVVTTPEIETPQTRTKSKKLEVRSILKPVTFPRLNVVVSDVVIQINRTIRHKRGGDSSGTGSSIPKFRILVVDDNEINLKVACRILEKHGHDPVPVKSGIEAIERAFDHVFDLILMDIFMPGMSGLDATKVIRQKELERGFPPIPIVAITANATLTDREQCLKAGMTDYITKPFTPQKLEHIIHKAIYAAAVSNL